MMNEKKREITTKSCNALQSTQTRYWIAKGYTEEEAKEKASERQRTFTLEKCIKKYGEEEGRRRFNERQEKWMKSFRKTLSENGDGRSPQSFFTKELIQEICLKLDIDEPKREKYITNKEKDVRYAIDFAYKNKMIEFNGDYWYCNPNKYDKDYFNRSKQMYTYEIWDYDKEKVEYVKRLGYDILVIWEEEYINNFYKTLQKCIDFLNE